MKSIDEQALTLLSSAERQQLVDKLRRDVTADPKYVARIERLCNKVRGTSREDCEGCEHLQDDWIAGKKVCPYAECRKPLAPEVGE